MKTVYNKSLFCTTLDWYLIPLSWFWMWYWALQEPLEFMRALKAGDFHQVFTVRATSFPPVDCSVHVSTRYPVFQKKYCSRVSWERALVIPDDRLPGLQLHSPLIGPFTAMAGSLWGKTPGLPSKHRCMRIVWDPAQPLLGQNPSLLDCKRPHAEISILLVFLVPQYGVCFQTCVWTTCL